MKEFDVTITETLKRTVTVQAEDKDQAMDLVHDQHSQSIHVLDADDFDSMTIETTGERELNMLNVLLVEPMKSPEQVQISDSLEALQGAVGGLIETAHYFRDPVEIICNEEGKINGSDPNRAICNDKGEMIDIVFGSFLIVGDGEENFESLSPEMMDKYSKMFEKPERFFKLAGEIVVQKIDPPKDKDATKKAEPER